MFIQNLLQYAICGSTKRQPEQTRNSPDRVSDLAHAGFEQMLSFVRPNVGSCTFTTLVDASSSESADSGTEVNRTGPIEIGSGCKTDMRAKYGASKLGLLSCSPPERNADASGLRADAGSDGTLTATPRRDVIGER